MTTIKLTQAGTLTTFDKPVTPENDPLKRWRSQWGNEYREVEPKFSEENHRDRSGRKFVTGDWSGIAICRKSQNKAIKAVEATWVVPNCYPPQGAVANTVYTASFWFGIDGDGRPGDKSIDILQAGVDCDAVAGGNSRTARARAWWEWAPGASHWIPELPVSPGDTIHGVILVVAMGGQPKAVISLHNKTSAVASSFMVEPIEHTLFIGNCAEWIVEQIPPGLARYGAVWFDGARAFLDSGAEIGPELSGELSIPYAIPDAQKRDISKGYILGSNLVRCAYGNSDRTESAAKIGT